MLSTRWENAILLVLVWVYALRYIRTKRENRPRLLITDAWTGLNWLMWWLVLFIPAMVIVLTVVWFLKLDK